MLIVVEGEIKGEELLIIGLPSRVTLPVVHLPSKFTLPEPTLLSVNINTKSTSCAGAAGASAKDQPKVSSNFRTLVLISYLMVLTSLFLVKLSKRNNLAKHGLKRIMINSKGLFFFKFGSRAGLEAVLEGGHWLIRKSPIILNKWAMDTRLLKEELTRIPIWVKLHDVAI
nr:zinc knuckle CX2CX4HX4C [Tanacetum cinerariifolium]